MSLDFDLRKTSLPKKADGEGLEWTDATNPIIWDMIVAEVGPELTEDNIEEFMLRNILWSTACGSFTGMPNYSMDDLRQHVGLKTNVFPRKTRTQWLKKLSDVMDRAGKMAISRHETEWSRLRDELIAQQAEEEK